MCAFCDLLGKNSKIFKIRRVIFKSKTFSDNHRKKYRDTWERGIIADLKKAIKDFMRIINWIQIFKFICLNKFI